MNSRLGKNVYGKSAINLSKIIRHEGYHEFRQITVNTLLEGDFEAAHTKGDNKKIIATDTQKNTVYALAKEYFTSSVEAFGIELSKHFMNNNDHLSNVIIEIVEHPWKRMEFNNNKHPHSFIGGNSEKHSTTITQNINSLIVSSGIKDLLLLKTTDSGFQGFIRDEYTTLKETSERILSTKMEASWLYNATDIDYIEMFNGIHNVLVKEFAFHKSLSLQQTLYAMGEAVLKEYEILKEITIKMPNKHHILFNLEQFDIENKNEIFIATDEPYGYIMATITRDNKN